MKLLIWYRVESNLFYERVLNAETGSNTPPAMSILMGLDAWPKAWCIDTQGKISNSDSISLNYSLFLPTPDEGV